jgi:hypothetical protein
MKNAVIIFFISLLIISCEAPKNLASNLVYKQTTVEQFLSNYPDAILESTKPTGTSYRRFVDGKTYFYHFGPKGLFLSMTAGVRAPQRVIIQNRN